MGICITCKHEPIWRDDEAGHYTTYSGDCRCPVPATMEIEAVYLRLVRLGRDEIKKCECWTKK